jgi:hypothetical protein
VLDIGATNAEIVKRGIDAFNRHDSDAFANLTTPDFEWFPAMTSALGAVNADWDIDAPHRDDGSGALGGRLRVIVPTELLKTPVFVGVMETVGIEPTSVIA